MHINSKNVLKAWEQTEPVQKTCSSKLQSCDDWREEKGLEAEPGVLMDHEKLGTDVG